MESALYIVAIVLIFGAIIVVHEAGHFIVAKLSKMRVHEFAIGMGPVLAAVQRGETQYSLRAVPVGGMVRIAGVEPGDEEDPRGFNTRPVWQRIAAIAAGPMMNLVLAFAIFFVIYTAMGVPQGTTSVIGKVIPGKAAEEAGLRPGDRVVSVAGVRAEASKADVDSVRRLAGRLIPEATLSAAQQARAVDEIAEALFAIEQRALADFPIPATEQAWFVREERTAIRGVIKTILQQSTGKVATRAGKIRNIAELAQGTQMSAMRAAIRLSPNRRVPFVIERAGQPLSLMIMPKGRVLPVRIVQDEDGELTDAVPGKVMTGEIGVVFRTERVEHLGLWTGFTAGIQSTWKSIELLVQGVGWTFSRKVPVGDSVGGPVRIVSEMYNQARASWLALLQLAGVITVTIAILNLVPFPALDGSRIAFLIFGVVFRWISGRPFDTRKEEMIHQIGLVVLLLFILVVTMNDVWGLVRPPQ